MSQTFEKELSVGIEKFPAFFNDIAEKFIPKERHEEFVRYIEEKTAEAPHLFNPVNLRKRRLELKKKQREKKKKAHEETLPERKRKLKELLSKSLQPRHVFIDSLNGFTEPQGSDQQCFIELKRIIELEKTTNNISLLCKIYIGKHAKYLQDILGDKAMLFAMLKMDNIVYSRTEISFAIKLAKLVDIYPKLSLINVPLRMLKSNLSILESCLQEEKDFWSTPI